MRGWRDTTLGELIRITHGFAFKGEFFSDAGPAILLTPGNFKADGGLKLKGEREKYYVGPVPSEYVLSPGDLLVAMTDLTQNAPILGSAAFIPEGACFLHNQRLGKVWVDSRKAAARFVYYLLNSSPVRAQIRATATGATVKHTAPARIGAVRVRIPASLEEQERIAAVLAAYDDLINNAEQRIRVLDQMVRALYREWFVLSRVPSLSCVSTNERNPSRWRRGRLDDLAVESRRGVPKGRLLEGPARYVGLEHIPRRSYALDDWEEVADLGSSKLRFLAGEVLFGKIRPYFHKVCVAPFDGVCSADTIVVAARSPEARALMTCILGSDELVQHASATANGAKMPRASWKVMAEFPVLVPPSSVVTAFSIRVEPMLAEQQQLVSLTMVLRRSRDLLLPRLLSGKLSVKAAERAA